MKELKNISENQGFKVPDNYFENFSNKLLNEIEKDKKKKTKIYNLANLRVAASFIAVILMSTILYLKIDSKQNDTLTSVDKLAYLECAVDEIDYDILVEESSQINNSDFDNDTKLLILEDEISDDEIIDVLTNETSDY